MSSEDCLARAHRGVDQGRLLARREARRLTTMLSGMPEAQPLALLRRDIARKPGNLRKVLTGPAIRKNIFDGVSSDEKKAVKAFANQNSENALKTAPKVSFTLATLYLGSRRSHPGFVVVLCRDKRWRSRQRNSLLIIRSRGEADGAVGAAEKVRP